MGTDGLEHGSEVVLISHLVMCSKKLISSPAHVHTCPRGEGGGRGGEGKGRGGEGGEGRGGEGMGGGRKGEKLGEGGREGGEGERERR